MQISVLSGVRPIYPQANVINQVSSPVLDVPASPTRYSDPSGPAYIVNISNEGRAAYENSVRAQSGCETCKNRKYVDVSSDSTVSFQTPTRISPAAAPAMVAAHESEHVRNNKLDASNRGRRIISQSVSMQTSICPECGRIYVSGGETRTVSATDNKQRQNTQPESQPAGVALSD